MICQRKRNNEGRGPRYIIGAYTFLELALAMAIIAIVFIGAVPFATAALRERHLRNVADSIADLVQQQRQEAEKAGIPRALTLTKKGIERSISRRENELVLEIPESCQWWVRRPGGKWEAPGGWVWEFSAYGTVSPFSVRIKEGDIWIENDFDFLTGRLLEERYSF